MSNLPTNPTAHSAEGVDRSANNLESTHRTPGGIGERSVVNAVQGEHTHAGVQGEHTHGEHTHGEHTHGDHSHQHHKHGEVDDVLAHVDSAVPQPILGFQPALK